MEKVIKDIYREQRVSNKTGRAYQMLVIVFANGYKMSVFLNDEQTWILSSIPLVQ